MKKAWLHYNTTAQPCICHTHGIRAIHVSYCKSEFDRTVKTEWN